MFRILVAVQWLSFQNPFKIFSKSEQLSAFSQTLTIFRGIFQVYCIFFWVGLKFLYFERNFCYLARFFRVEHQLFLYRRGFFPENLDKFSHDLIFNMNSVLSTFSCQFYFNQGNQHLGLFYVKPTANSSCASDDHPGPQSKT